MEITSKRSQLKYFGNLLIFLCLLQESRARDCLHQQTEQDLDVQGMQLSFMIQSVSLSAIMAM